MLRRSPLYQLTAIQFKEFVREPAVVFWAIVFPILMAWGLGIAFNNKGDEVQHVALIKRIGVENTRLNEFLLKGKIQPGRETNIRNEIVLKISDRYLGNRIYHVLETDWGEGILMLKRGRVPMIIREDADSIRYFFDPKNPEAKLMYLQLSASVNNKDVLDPSGVIKPLMDTGTRYIDFLVPGLIAMGIMMSLMWGVSYELIDKRAKKLLRRMVATPMRKSSMLISHFIARFILSIIESACIYLFAALYFHTLVQGSYLALFLLILAGNIAFSGIAIFVSSRTSKTEIGNGLINAIVMPMMVLSGIFFSYHNFPDWAVSIIQYLPLTMLADGVRSIFYEGAGLAGIAASTGILTGVGLVFFFVGMRIYKWY